MTAARSTKYIHDKEKTMQYYHKIMTSPVGKLTLVATDDGLCAVLFIEKGHYDSIRKANHPILVKAERQLAEYFSAFDVPLDIQEGTPFQKKAWKALSTIPYGTTISYREQAKKIGDVSKARPIGQANGKNPVSIIVPCHRVIGASGKLTGYGGGLSKKEYLLKLEERFCKPAKKAA